MVVLSSEAPTLPASVFPVVVHREKTAVGELLVLRDDLLPAGTKQRALQPYLLELREQGIREVVYASPFSGFAQIALAVSCQELGLRCRIFAEACPLRGEGQQLVLHAASRKAKGAGADVTLCPSLGVAHEVAVAWESNNPSTFCVPLGLDHPRYIFHLRQTLIEVWKEIESLAGGTPRQVWVSLGSGTLSGTLRSILPSTTKLCSIDVHVLQGWDPRIQNVRQLPGVTYFSAPEAFCEEARYLPPIPSNDYYDAKVWRFLTSHAQPGDLWWNVAG